TLIVPGRGALPVPPEPPSPGTDAGGGGGSSEGLGGSFRAGKSGVRTGSPVGGSGADGVNARGVVRGARSRVFRARGRSGSSTVFVVFEADGFSHDASSPFGAGGCGIGFASGLVLVATRPVRFGRTGSSDSYLPHDCRLSTGFAGSTSAFSIVCFSSVFLGAVFSSSAGTGLGADPSHTWGSQTAHFLRPKIRSISVGRTTGGASG